MANTWQRDRTDCAVFEYRDTVESTELAQSRVDFVYCRK